MYENGEADCTVIQHSQPFFCPWNKTISDSIALFYNADFWPTTFTRNSSSNFILAFICKLYTYLYLIRRHFLITLGCQINEYTRLAFLIVSPSYLHFFHPTWLVNFPFYSFISFFPPPYLFIRAYLFKKLS